MDATAPPRNAHRALEYAYCISVPRGHVVYASGPIGSSEKRCFQWSGEAIYGFAVLASWPPRRGDFHYRASEISLCRFQRRRVSYVRVIVRLEIGVIDVSCPSGKRGGEILAQLPAQRHCGLQKERKPSKLFQAFDNAPLP